MDSNIEKLYPKLKDVKPYGKDEIRPDEVKSWTEFDRALATFIVECLVTTIRITPMVKMKAPKITEDMFKNKG